MNMMRKIMVMIVASMLAAAIAVPAYATIYDRIMINGSEKTLQYAIQEVDAHIMVSLSALAGVTGMEVSWDASSASVNCNFNGEKYVFKPQSVTVQSGTAMKQMSSPMVIIDGRSYIPLNAVVDVFDGEIKNIEGRYEITLALVGDKAFGNFSYEELLQRAMKNSVALTKAETNLERAKIINGDVVEDYIEMPGSSGILEAVRLQSLLEVEGSEISLKTAEIAVASTKDSLDYSLTSLLNQGIMTEQAIDLSEEELDLARKTQEQNQLKYDQGMLSATELDQSKETLKTKELTVVINKSKRDALVVKLDSMLKLGPGSYGFLKTSQPIYSPLNDRNLEAHVKDVLAYSPDLWTLEQAIKLNQTSVTYYVFNAGLEPYDAKLLDVKKAKLDLQNAKQSTETGLRGAYEQILQLESNIATLNAELRKAESSLTIAQANYKVGLITRLTYDQAVYMVKGLEYQVTNAKASYETLKNSYLKPWATD